jgi:hypothetical protein
MSLQPEAVAYHTDKNGSAYFFSTDSLPDALTFSKSWDQLGFRTSTYTTTTSHSFNDAAPIQQGQLAGGTGYYALTVTIPGGNWTSSAGAASLSSYQFNVTQTVSSGPLAVLKQILYPYNMISNTPGPLTQTIVTKLPANGVYSVQATLNVPAGETLTQADPTKLVTASLVRVA